MAWKRTRQVIVICGWIVGIFYTGKTVKGNIWEYMSHRSFMAIESYGQQGLEICISIYKNLTAFCAKIQTIFEKCF